MDILKDYEKSQTLLESRLNARSNNDWKTELSMQIELDKQLLSDIGKGNTIAPESADDIKYRIDKNKILYRNGIKPINEENSMTAYNFIRLVSRDLLPLLSIIMVLLLSADFVSGESDEGTFRFLLTQPISRSKVMISKIIVCSVICVLVEYSIIFVFLWHWDLSMV